MKRLGFPVLLIALLSGCMTTDERAARVQAEVEEMMQVYGPGCEKLGFTKSTEEWRQCILRLSARENYRTRPVTTSCTAFNGFYNCISY